MALSAVLVFILTAVAVSPVIGQQDSCAACNCPLDSNADLDGYITARINEIMGNEPRKCHEDRNQKRKRERERDRERQAVHNNDLCALLL